MRTGHRRLKRWAVCWTVLAWIALASFAGQAPCAPPNPVLDAVFPPGGQAGTTIEVIVSGQGLLELRGLRCGIPGVEVRQDAKEKTRFSIRIPEQTPPGLYDVRTLGGGGVSSPRSLLIGNRPERQEADAGDAIESAQPIPLNVTVNGRIEKKGDRDHYRFSARRGQRVVLECWAERIDSPLRSVLEVLDLKGRRLASNRGYYGFDSLLVFEPREDGEYVVRVSDLIYSGGANHYYRLDVDTEPRVAFAFPPAIQQGGSTRVMLYGWNLPGAEDAGAFGLSKKPVELFAKAAVWPLRVPLRPSQIGVDGLSFQLPGGHAPALVGVTDLPVILGKPDNESPPDAQDLPLPCAVAGQLPTIASQDWFAIQAKRGEVLYLEAFADRLRARVDLDVRVIDAENMQELAGFSDERLSVGGANMPTRRLDPVGRFVAPRDGRYLILVRNLIGDQRRDPSRIYLLTLRREEPDVRVAAAPHGDGPAGINVQRGGRTLLDVWAVRRRGQTGSIRIECVDPPPGIHCPDVWLGPGVNRGPLVVSADEGAEAAIGSLQLRAVSPQGVTNRVRGSVVVRSGQPTPWARLTDDVPVGVAGDASLRLTASAYEARKHALYGLLKPRYSPGSVVDVAIHVERRQPGHAAPIRLMGVGLPPQMEPQTAVIPQGADKGYISFYLPPATPQGRYSLTVRGETTTLNAKGKPEPVIIHSNAVTIDVEPAAFQLRVDPFAPTRIRRGEVVQIRYAAERIDGYIGKIHTELAMPGMVTDVVGLRGRGVTFVGQTETGVIQVIANEDAPLGQQPFLRLYGVGVVEDQPAFEGSCFLRLQVIDED